MPRLKGLDAYEAGRAETVLAGQAHVQEHDVRHAVFEKPARRPRDILQSGI